MEAEGEKLGVYRDEAGEVFLVEARCPHLGCQLEWNPDEKPKPVATNHPGRAGEKAPI